MQSSAATRSPPRTPSRHKNGEGSDCDFGHLQHRRITLSPRRLPVSVNTAMTSISPSLSTVKRHGVTAGDPRAMETASATASSMWSTVSRLHQHAVYAMQRHHYPTAVPVWQKALRHVEQYQWQQQHSAPPRTTPSSPSHAPNSTRVRRSGVAVLPVASSSFHKPPRGGLLGSRSEDLSYLLLVPTVTPVTTGSTLLGTPTSALVDNDDDAAALWHKTGELRFHDSASPPRRVSPHHHPAATTIRGPPSVEDVWMDASQDPFDNDSDEEADLERTMATHTSTVGAMTISTATMNLVPGKNKAEYDEGMDFFRYPLDLPPADVVVPWLTSQHCVHDEVSRADQVVASIMSTLLFNLGRCHHQQGQQEEAYRCYRRALRTLGLLPSSSWQKSRSSQRTTDVWSKYTPSNGTMMTVPTTPVDLKNANSTPDSQLPDSCLDNSILIVSLWFSSGHIQYMRGDHVESLKTYMSALTYARSHCSTLIKSSSKSGSSDDSLPVAACMNAVGVLHYIMPQGDGTMALEMLKAALRIRKKHCGDAHPDVGTTWNNIGRVYFQQGVYDQAMDAYRRALRIRRMVSTTSSVDNMSVSSSSVPSSLSRTFTSDSLDEVHHETMRTASMDSLPSLSAPDSVDVAATLFNIGQVHHQRGHQDKALRHYQEFLKMARRHFGDYHRDICIVTTCIGQVLHERKEFKKALKAFHHALKIGNKALGPVHAEIAITLNKLGNLYYETGDLDAALRTYHQGLQVELEVLEPGNPNVCVTYTNIAEIHKQRSEFDHALRHYEKVLSLQRKYSPDPLDVANTLSSIGYVRHQIGDYQGAMDVNQECLRIRRDVKGDDDEEVASTLTHIALVLLKLEMHDMALGVLTEAYRIRMKLQEQRHGDRPATTVENRDVAFTLYNIALIFHHQGSHDEALRFYRETARVEKLALGQAHRDLSITYYNIGQIFYQRGEMDLAIDSFREALNIELECFGRSHPTCARTLNEIGNIELQRGNMEGLMACYTEACRIYRAAGFTDDQLVIYGRSLWRFDKVQPNAAPAA